MIIFVVTGNSNSGKDTTTIGIKNAYPAVEVIKFSQPMKQLLANQNGFDASLLESREFRNQLIPSYLEVGIEKTWLEKMVEFYRYVKIHEPTWSIDQVAERVHGLISNGVPLLFNDVRSLVELEFIKRLAENYGYHIVHVALSRPGAEIAYEADEHLEAIRAGLARVSFKTLNIVNTYYTAEHLITASFNSLTKLNKT
jgi:hypothetical protein